MKTNESFGERVLNVWAAIVRVLFPRYCVKHLTLRNRNNAVYYMLGLEKELKLIDKLKLSNEEIAARVWSPETRVALLRSGSTALIGQIRNEEELDAVISTNVDHNLIAAMRVYTPSRAKMLKLVSTLDVQMLRTLAGQVPTVFDVLKPWEILGIAEKEIPSPDCKRWVLALKLAESKSDWAPLFLIELRKIVPNRLGERGQELMDRFFEIAFSTRKDISEMMPYFCVFQKEKYAKVRDNHKVYKSFFSYFRIMFPQLVKDLLKDMYRSIYDINLNGELTSEEDAYAWLKIGYARISDPEIFNCLVENLQQIKARVQPKLYGQLFWMMIAKAPTYAGLIQLYRLADNVLETEIPVKLVVGMEENQAGATLKFAFPFKGWDEKLASRAIQAMALKKEFPADRLGELPENLQKIAVTTMEEQSQISAIRDRHVVELVKLTQLLPKAEVEFLRLRLSLYAPEKVEYVGKYQLVEDNFRYLLSALDIDFSQRESLISTYALKWGLTEEQYCMVMQSELASLAPFLKKYVRK